MARTTEELRELWKAYECAEARMVVVPFGPDRIRVAPETADAWPALAAVMRRHGYCVRMLDTDSYNCRNIKGTDRKSLHAFGIALDVNWQTNPFQDHGGQRPVRYSAQPSQEERAEDVRTGRADTDMTPAMIADVLKIRTCDGLPVFRWGGDYVSCKDCMHFEIVVAPDEMAKGVDESSVVGVQPIESLESDSAVNAEEGVNRRRADIPPPASSARHVAIARPGLHLRAGPGSEYPILEVYPPGAEVFVIARNGAWALADLVGDGLVDGFMLGDFLRPAPQEPAVAGPGHFEEAAVEAVAGTAKAAAPAPSAPSAAPDFLDELTVEKVKPLFPFTRRENIAANLPFVVAGLRSRNLCDPPMAMMALATIRAETEGFVPISEGKSRYNTQHTPFDLYEPGTRVGKKLGNTEPGDGPRFRGRGFVQLTGRANYTRIGQQIGVDLVTNPEAANDGETAGVILAQFLKNKETGIRAALGRSDLGEARRLVNGGAHGLERFSDCCRRGETLFRA